MAGLQGRPRPAKHGRCSPLGRGAPTGLRQRRRPQRQSARQAQRSRHSSEWSPPAGRTSGLRCCCYGGMVVHALPSPTAVSDRVRTMLATSRHPGRRMVLVEL
eukprot:scaffold1844_cov133-Isochrysis_galbana.AAC.5